MAVFGNVDADIHILTWVAQVDTSKPEEVIRLCEMRWPDVAPMVAASIGGELHAAQDAFLAAIDPARSDEEKKSAESRYLDWFKPALPGLIAETRTKELIKTINLVQRIMRDIYYQGGPTRADFNAFFDFLRQFHTGFEAESGGSSEGDIVPLHGAQEVILPGENVVAAFPPIMSIAANARWLISETIAGRNRLAECSECHGLHIPMRREQAYCSHRCANRAGMRRRRKEKSDVLP